MDRHGNKTLAPWEESRMRHIAMAMTLLSTHAHDELFEPLLLRKDQERLEQGRGDVEAMGERAFKRTQRRTWIVGRNLPCPTERKNIFEEESEPTGRKLSFQHWRAGHFHRVRHGKNHEEVKVQWFRPTLVRPDLPSNNKTRVYQTA
jgi:hypothetical protein